LKGGAKMVGLDNVSRVAHEMEATLQTAMGVGRALAREEVTVFLGLLDQVRGVLELVAQGREGEALGQQLSSAAISAGGAPVGIPAEPQPAAGEGRRLGSDRVRVSVEKLDELQNLVDDLTLQRARLAGRSKELRKALKALEKVAPEGEDDLSSGAAASLRYVARMLGRGGFAELLEDLHRLDQVASEIQAQVFELRMVPLAEVLDEYQRTVRDLGRDLGKDVSLTVDGGFTEIDKRLLEAVQGPLTHLVRNAVDHGVESPEERRVAGKNPVGEVTIRAYHKGGAVVIEVEDDGRGLDPSEIRSKAVEKGLLGADAAAALGEAEALYLLCEPGFTTRGSVTEFSGRGVGLDVVKVQVEKLKGSLVIHSEKGRYARFRLYLPLAISTLSTLLVRAGGEVYAMPSLFVDRCVRTSAAELAQRGGSWPYGDRVLPVVSLARALGAEAGAQETAFLVVLRFRGRHMIVQVDALEDEREVVLKPLGRHLREVPYVLGASFLADGPPVPVLNVVDLHARWTGLEAACRYRQGGAARAPVVLVVDDSVTTRHLEQNLLEHMGYAVLAATDGVEAWRTLERERVDAVLTDVEMPAMDGLELTRRIRGREDLARLPVVAISNRTSEADMAAGYGAGVDAYLRKDRFSQRELGATLDALLVRGADGRVGGRT
ncbi:MAG: response regulator, partial [Proteobacteria bacterium]|nr:response regulator [Pseudomonadota bacterium]